MDDHINNVHILNDHQLKCKGAVIIPFANIEENAPIPLYAGAFEVQKPNQAKMWICKPCDAIVFRKSNFRTHHRSDKHAENLKRWSERLPRVPEAMAEKDQDDQNGSYIVSLMDLEQAIISIETMVPIKYRNETAAMVSIFFNKHLAKDNEIDLIQNFKQAQDPTILDQDQRHWINIKFEALRQKKDPRRYMKTKWRAGAVMIRRTAAQKEEIKPIADLARALFATLINHEFIPTNYLIILAIIMNQKHLLNYPESAISLSNGFYLDLFLNPGTVIDINPKKKAQIEKIDSEVNPDLKRLFIKEDSQEMMCGNFNPEDDEDFQDLLIQEPIMQDINEQIKDNSHNPEVHSENPEWTLEEKFLDIRGNIFKS